MKTMQTTGTVEMKAMRAIQRKSQYERVRSEDGKQDVAKWIRKRRKLWNKHIKRMDDNRLAKSAENNTTAGKRTRGKQPNRWKQYWISSSGEAALDSTCAWKII